MEVVAYSKEYSGVLCSWLEVRGLDTGLIQELPEHGYVCLEDGHPIGAGFIRKCEGKFAILDSFITDPTAPAESRDQAMDLLLSANIVLADKWRISQLIAFTVDNFTLSRAQRFGMVATSMTTLVLPLKGTS